jgi:flagellar export protein FliJ
MARFRYHLQVLLDAFAERERAAQAALARALRERRAAQAVALALERRIDELRRARPLAGQAWLPAELDRAEAALRRRRADQRGILVTLDARVERLQAELERAAQRRSAFERHRERTLALFNAEQARREARELDEANALRRGARTGRLRIADDVIVLHRPSGHPIVVNADLIETVEAAEDRTTVVTLTSGNTIVATEGLEAVRDAVIEFRRRIAAPLG